MKLIIITILVYSFVLTVFNLYKDSSSYFMVDTIDFIFAGPFGWLLCLCVPVLRKIIKTIPKKEKVRKVRDQKYIAKVVKKIIKQYKKKEYTDDYFDFSFREGRYSVNDVEGWNELMRSKPSNERLNNKFTSLMLYQKDETIAELKKYCEIMNEEKMKKDNCDDYFISIYKEKGLLKVI